MNHRGTNITTVKIFVASGSDLAEERKELIQIFYELGKLHPHLKLDVKKWENDLESGSYQEDRIQDAIIPILDDSQIVIALFYSRIGKFTLEEYKNAIRKKKKVFLYFKKRFSTEKSDELKKYKKVVDFREELEEENKSLFKTYENIDQFRDKIKTDLNLYLTKKYPPSPPVTSPSPPVAEADDKFPKYLTNLPAKTIDLVGREEELKEMARTLARTDRVLLVNGLGGVGKTELCKRYFWDNADNYNHLAWVDVVGNIRESFVNAFNIEDAGFGETDTEDERFEKIIRFLNRLDKNTLLVADNIENPKDEDMDRLRALPFKVIASSRLNLDGFEIHTLDFLSPEKCKDLFYKHYKGKRDDTHVDKIVARCGRHTLSVELLARTAMNAAMPVKELHEKLEIKGFNLNDVIGDKVHVFWHDEKEKKRFFNHLLTIFDLSNVTEEELHVLTQLSVLPPVYIPIADCCEWMKLENKEAVNSLVFKGWLSRDELGFKVFMHQVIQEVIRHKTPPGAEKCKQIISSLKWKLYLKLGESPINKKDYIIFAESVLLHIDENDKELAILSNNLAEIYYYIGIYKKALRFHLKALYIRGKVLDKNDPDIAESYSNLALIHKRFGKLEKALEFQKKALKIRERVLKGHPDLGESYNNIALIYNALGEPGKALKYQMKDIKILEQVFPGKNHPDLATSYNNLALIYKALGKLEKAMEFQKKALKTREEILDKPHPDLAQSYNNLAEIYRAMREHDEALKYHRRALKIREQIFHESHPSLAISFHNLGLTYKELGNFKSALQNSKKAVRIFQENFPEDHPWVKTAKSSLQYIKGYISEQKGIR